MIHADTSDSEHPGSATQPCRMLRLPASGDDVHAHSTRRDSASGVRGRVRRSRKRRADCIRVDTSGAQGSIEYLISQSIRENLPRRFERVLTAESAAGKSHTVRFRTDKGGLSSSISNWRVECEWAELPTP